MDFTKIPEWLALKPRYFFAVALATGILLFAPATLRETLGLDAFLDTNRTWVGIAFVASLVVWSTHGLAATGHEVVQWWKRRHLLRARIATLERLSPEERGILKRYVSKESKTLTLNASSGVHANLEALAVISRSTTVSHHGMWFDYNLQPWAWEHLRSHPALLSGPAVDPIEPDG